jgi:hypothetical protein
MSGLEANYCHNPDLVNQQLGATRQLTTILDGSFAMFPSVRWSITMTGGTDLLSGNEEVDNNNANSSPEECGSAALNQADNAAPVAV